MATPTTPQIFEVLNEGLKRAGIVNPPDDEVLNAHDNAFQEVKRDIMFAAHGHYMLDTQVLISMVKGQRQYDLPTSYHSLKNIIILDGPTDWRGTATAGTSTTITLAADFDEASDDVIGHDIVITGGTSVDDRRNITAYDNSTKIATAHTAFTTTPDTTSTYLVSNMRWSPRPILKSEGYARLHSVGVLDLPQRYALFGETIYLVPTPDKIYTMLIEYTSDLDQLDETGTLFKRFLRKYRGVFTQGVAVKTLQTSGVDRVRRFPASKLQVELSLYSGLLDQMAEEAMTISQVEFHDI